MTFSIVVPVYNVAPYLSACLDSLLAQTYTDFEVLLVNDGSTDISGVLCDGYAARDPRFTVIHQQNGGLSRARNSGIDRARGDILLFLDSDDYYREPTFLASLAEIIKEQSPDVVVFNSQKVAEDGERILSSPYFAEPTAEDGLSLDTLCDKGLLTACAWNKAVKASFFKDGALLFLPDITSEDMDWCLRLALTAERFSYLDTAAVAYRQRASSISGTMTEKKVGCLVSNLDRCLALLDGAPEEKKAPLLSYLAYQYATMLYALCRLPRRESRRRFAEALYPHRDLLACGKGRKVTLLHTARRLVGYRGALGLLRLLTLLRKG